MSDAKRKRVSNIDPMPMISIRLPQPVMDYYKSFPMHTRTMREVLTDYALTHSKEVIRKMNGKNTRGQSER